MAAAAAAAAPAVTYDITDEGNKYLKQNEHNWDKPAIRDNLCVLMRFGKDTSWHEYEAGPRTVAQLKDFMTRHVFEIPPSLASILKKLPALLDHLETIKLVQVVKPKAAEAD